MKQVLIIDESPLLRDYLRYKLAENGVGVQTVANGLEGITKLRTSPFDLTILDYNLRERSCLAFLEERHGDAVLSAVPVIVTARHIDKKNLFDLINYKVNKVFSKPILVDALCDTISELIGANINIDKAPSRVTVFVNDNILFIDIALGLNYDKLDVLRLRITELLALYKIADPQVLLSFKESSLSFVDAPKLEKLLRIALEAANNRGRSIRVLSSDDFVRLYIQSNPDYAGISVADSFQDTLEGMLGAGDEGGKDNAKGLGVSESENSRALNQAEASVQFRFKADAAGGLSSEELVEFGQRLSIAVVDDDFVIQELLKSTFADIGTSVSAYSDGGSFLSANELKNFDLIFLDLLMPKMSGFDVLKKLRELAVEIPIIVLSAINRRDAISKAFQYGIKSYLLKPLSPEAIFRKAVEILRPNI